MGKTQKKKKKYNRGGRSEDTMRRVSHEKKLEHDNDKAVRRKIKDFIYGETDEDYD
jgi:hypothetical protein